MKRGSPANIWCHQNILASEIPRSVFYDGPECSCLVTKTNISYGLTHLLFTISRHISLQLQMKIRIYIHSTCADWTCQWMCIRIMWLPYSMLTIHLLDRNLLLEALIKAFEYFRGIEGTAGKCILIPFWNVCFQQQVSSRFKLPFLTFSPDRIQKIKKDDLYSIWLQTTGYSILGQSNRET